MPRVSEVDFATLPADLRRQLEERQREIVGEPTWPAVAAHRPTQLLHILALMRSFATDGLIPARLRDLAVVTVSKANECTHCAGRHSVRLNAAGLPHATIDALLDSDCPGLEPDELLVRDYALAVTRNAGRLRDSLFDRLHARFSEPEIVELTLLIALAGFFNAFNDALGVALDPTHVDLLDAQRAAEGAGD